MNYYKSLIFLFLFSIFSTSIIASGCAASSGITYTVTITNGTGPGTLYRAIMDANSDNVGGRIVMGNGLDSLVVTTALPTITVDSLEILPTSQYIYIDGYHAITNPVFVFHPSVTHSCYSDSIIIHRTVSTTFTVYNTNDSGPGSLREAIGFANQASSVDQIEFAISGPAPHIIYPLSSYYIRYGLIIDGKTQPLNGYSGISPRISFDGGHSVQTCFEGEWLPYQTSQLDAFELYGLYIHGFHDAIRITGFEGVEIGASNNKNIISDNSDNGILINNCWRIRIGNNFIGIDSTGMISRGNNKGIKIVNNNYNNDLIFIWDNVISGNNYGISIENSTGIYINSNKIGIDFSGLIPIPNNVYGIEIINSQILRIGLANSGYENIICGNTVAGIYIAGNAAGDTIHNNLIGVNSNMTKIPNGTGILLDTGANNVYINHNRISGNGTGVEIRNAAHHNLLKSNLIYENDSSGIICLGPKNTFTLNSIWQNGYKGIETNNTGNDSIQKPIITLSDFSGVYGTSEPFAQIELYYSNSSNQHSQGEIYFATVQANLMGTWGYPSTLYNSLEITATQTNAVGNTSEFADVIPSVNLGPDTIICAGEIYMLIAGAGLSSFIWSTGELTNIIYPQTTGIYSIIGITYTGDTLYDSAYVQVVICIGIEEESKASISIYPVPSIDYVIIDVPLDISAAGYFIEVINASGVTVFREYSSQSRNRVGLMRSKGIHFIRLMDTFRNCFYSKNIVLQ